MVNIALSLKSIGVGKGQIACVCSAKRFELLILSLGIQLSGATLAASDITAGKATMLHRLNCAPPTVMFCSLEAYQIHRETFAKVPSLKTIIVFEDEAPVETISLKNFLTEQAQIEEFVVDPVDGMHDWTLVLFSSGTTGLPKGISTTHLNYIYFITNLIDHNYNNGKVVLNTREWYYTYGYGYTIGCLYSGATIVYSPTNVEYELLAAIDKYKVDVIQLAPSTLNEFRKSTILDNFDVSSVKRIISASTTCDADLVNDTKRRFPNLRDIHQLYGASEIGCVTLTERLAKGPKSGSVGPPNIDYVIKVADLESKEALGPNQRGELWVKFPNIEKQGYIGVPDFVNSEGFFATGDVGYYDEDGHFFIVDRIKELIKFNSFQVAPAELEAVLIQHPEVRDAGVTGAPHEQYGHVPTAFVVLQPGATVTEEELVAYVDTMVSKRMRLEGGVRFVDSIPYGNGAKLDRKALKLML